MSITFYPGYFNEGEQIWHTVAGVDPMNVCNANAVDIARSLGLDVAGGEIEPILVADVERRCTRFLRECVGRPDAAIPASVSGGGGCATFVDSERRAGYLQNQVARLLVVARDGRDRGASHIYGS